MGKRNKVVKLTKKKIDYIIRAKTRNDSNKNIAVDMKIGKSTVKYVWTYWLNHKAPIPIQKFGRKKHVTDEKTVALIIQYNAVSWKNLQIRRAYMRPRHLGLHSLFLS